MVAASQTFIVVVYIATPSDLSFHLSTSGTRLQFFPFMLLVLIAVYNATALLTGLFRGFFLRGHDPSFARRDARIANPER
jgi:hypothetical protein